MIPLPYYSLTLLSPISHPYPTLPCITPLPYYPQYHTLTLLSPVSHPYPTIPYITPLPYYPLYHTRTLLFPVSYPYLTVRFTFAHLLFLWSRSPWIFNDNWPGRRVGFSVSQQSLYNGHQLLKHWQSQTADHLLSKFQPVCHLTTASCHLVVGFILYSCKQVKNPWGFLDR